jgi:DNA-binding response OmpR family regulator
MKMTILVLESEPVVRSILREFLAREGYEVLLAPDLGKAVDWIEMTRPDLLVTGTYVSEIPGHDAAVYLRDRCPALRVLMVAGLPDDDRIDIRAVIENFSTFPKRFTAAELAQKVKEVLAVPVGSVVTQKRTSSEPAAP